MLEGSAPDREYFSEQAAVGIVHASPEGEILTCNARFAEIIGYPLEQIPGLTFKENRTPEDGPSVTEAFKR
jgi:PAS domain S-box-containing protein